MKEHNVKKLVFSSSSTVYGEPQFLPITESHPVGQNLLNGYAKSKYYIEGIIQDLCNSDKVYFTIFITIYSLFTLIYVYLLLGMVCNYFTIFQSSWSSSFWNFGRRSYWNS